jgi:glutamate N-acetyltransferase/amino-acid N-acetyltransferase
MKQVNSQMQLYPEYPFPQAKGFEAAGVKAGVKYEDRLDMSLIYSTVPCRAAATFTSNVVKAAPVLWDREQVAHAPYVQAIVTNTGMANAGTGSEGMANTKETAAFTANLLHLPTEAVLVSSTGVIGMQLPMDKIKGGITALTAAKSADPEAAHTAAKAMMTTDTVPKQFAATTVIGGKTVTISGMCKGSGMIHPNMCTMLAYLTTDAAISKEMLQKAVSFDVQDTFNMISVDGDTSTNDTLIILANGLAGNPEIIEEGEDYTLFLEALHQVNYHLARKMAGDGEGATALFTVEDNHADTKENARKLAKSVVCSSLTKAAIFGHDANWGRILCALGYSGATFDPEQIDIYFQGNEKTIHICHNGVACDYSEEEAARILALPEVTVLADMHMGQESAIAMGCDLSYDYVKINADYRS